MNNVIDRARKLRQKIENLSDYMTDNESLENAELLPTWKPNESYKTGQRVTYDKIVYKVLQDHTSQATWMPINTPSLFAKVLIPDENVISKWEQPGSTNPYMKGDKVTHNGQTWESTCDNNVWEPGVYGWNGIS